MGNKSLEEIPEEKENISIIPKKTLKQSQIPVVLGPKKCEFVYIQPKMHIYESICSEDENLHTNQQLQSKQKINANNNHQQLSIQQNINQKEEEIIEEPITDSTVKKKERRQSQENKIVVQWNTFIKIKKKNYLEDYIFVKEIGKGAFGTVSKIKMKYGGLYRAAKVIKGAAFTKKLQQKEKFLNEISIPMKLDHPNINKLFQVFQWKNQFVLILQLCEGGDLFNKIKRGGIFSQKNVSGILKQILSAVIYLHKNNIVHRDLKPQNILYDSQTNALKIIDFGTALQMKPNEKLTALVGTPYYIAPEVIKGTYNEKCDVWSCGVIMYLLLCGCPPFIGTTEKQILKRISSDSVTFKDKIWKNRSKQSQSLIKKMLCKDPESRISATEVLNSDWFSSAIDQEMKEDGKQILSNLQAFHFQNKLKAVVYTYIASQLYSNQDKTKLLKAFRQIDKDGDGVITKDQLLQIFNESGVCAFSEVQIDHIINLVDTNGSGLIDFTQFLVAASNQQELLQKERLQNAFTYLDTDHSGYITPEEIKNFLDDSEQTSNEIKKIFDEVDKNGDGKISKKQFLALLLQKNQP